jgi:hypothetical protein
LHGPAISQLDCNGSCGIAAAACCLIQKWLRGTTFSLSYSNFVCGKSLCLFDKAVFFVSKIGCKLKN